MSNLSSSMSIDCSHIVNMLTGGSSVPPTIYSSTGFTATEGKDVLLERLLNDDDTDRTGYKLALFTNAAGLDETSTLSDVTLVTHGELLTDPEFLNVDATATGTNTPDFIWSSSGWSNAGGALVSAGFQSMVSEGTNSCEIGKLYKVEYEISNLNAFIIAVAGGSTDIYGTVLPTVVGTHTCYVRATATDGFLIAASQAGVTLNYVRLKEVVEETLSYSSFVITQNSPAGTGYNASYPEVTLTATDGFTGVTGACIYTTGITPTLVHGVYTGASDDVAAGKTAKVTVDGIDLTSGTNGIIPDEGSQDILNILYKDVDLNSNPGYNLYAELYTNTTGVTERILEGTFTHPATGDYDRVKLGPTTSYTWTISGGSATIASLVEFPVATADYDANVIGAFLGTNGATKRGYFVDENPAQPIDVNLGDQYKVNLT